MICRRVITVSPSSFLLSVSSLQLTEIHFACRERKTLLSRDQRPLGGVESKGYSFSASFWFNSTRDRVCNNPRLSIKRTSYRKENRQPNSTGIEFYTSFGTSAATHFYETNCSLCVVSLQYKVNISRSLRV